MADTAQEKTEEPTARRRRKARGDGNVAQSPEVFNALMLLGVVLFFRAFGHSLYLRFAGDLTDSLRNITCELTILQVQTLFMEYAYRMALIFTPFALLLIALTFISSYMQYGWLFTTKALKLKWNFINIENGLKQLFSMNSLKNLGKSIVIIIVLLLVTFLTIRADITSFLGLASLSVREIFEYVSAMILRLLTNIFIAYIFIAAADFALTKHLYIKKLKMSKSEVKDEVKQLYGDPLIRSRMRSLMLAESRKRMMAAVPEADVVITNPTHVACALKYDAKVSQAPILVAKGKRLIAQRIKEIAREHNIPIVEDPPLARLIYSTTKVGQEIGMQLYSAVAEVLAYVYRLKNKKWAGR